MKRKICSNKKAFYEYEIIDSIEAGIVLQGCEVKSLSLHKASLNGSYAVIKDGEIWLNGFQIERYENQNTFSEYNPLRPKKLLLKRKEIKKFGEVNLQKGFTLIPLEIYFVDGKAKVELAVCRGKKLYDKRQAEKAKEFRKEIK